MRSLDIIIPVYNSGNAISTLINKLNSWNPIGFKFHVIFVDDCSSHDNYAQLKEQLTHAIFSFQLIKHAINYGQHTATATGFSMSSSDFIATIDDDLQHEPADIEALFNHLLTHHCDLVYGVFNEKKHGYIRNLGTKILQNILRIDGRDYSMVTSFRVMKKHITSVIKHKQTQIFFLDDFLLSASHKTGSYTINHQERGYGESGYTSRKLFQMALNILVLHSSLPLKIISRLGLIMSLAFFVIGCSYIYDKLFNDVAIGFTSLIVAIFFTTGLILFSLGIIGEYIRRIWISKQQLDWVIIEETC